MSKARQRERKAEQAKRYKKQRTERRLEREKVERDGLPRLLFQAMGMRHLEGMMR